MHLLTVDFDSLFHSLLLFSNVIFAYSTHDIMSSAEVKQEEGTEAFVITCNPDAANITMEKVFNGFKIRVTIYFTSQRFNAELDGDEQASSGGDVDKEVEESMLPREHCISHLIESRRTGFFTSTAPRLLNCICISRIVKVT